MNASLCAGGSYLIDKVQATGISFGLEPIFLLSNIEGEATQVQVISIGEDVAAVELAEKALEKGLYADYPSGDVDLESGQSLVEADSFIRRHWIRKDGKDAEAIDFYVPGLEFRVSNWYINDDRDRGYLESATGLVLDNMPVVEQDTLLSRM